MTYLDYALRGKTDWWRYVAALLLGPLAAVVLALAVTLPLAWAGRLPDDFAEQLLTLKQPGMFLLLNGALFGTVLLGFAAAIWFLHRKRPGDVIGRWSWRTFSHGFAVWVAALVGLTLIDLAIAPAGFAATATSRTPAFAALALIGLAMQTFTEEFVFRGYLTQALLSATRRPAVAAVISGLLFGAIHIPNGWPQAANAVVFGVVTALIAIRTGGIAFTFGMHLINNLFGAVVVVSGGDVFRGSPGLFSQNTPHLMWWDAGATCAALVLVGVLVLRRPAARPNSPG